MAMADSSAAEITKVAPSATNSGAAPTTPNSAAPAAGATRPTTIVVELTRLCASTTRSRPTRAGTAANPAAPKNTDATWTAQATTSAVAATLPPAATTTTNPKLATPHTASQRYIMRRRLARSATAPATSPNSR